MEIFHELPGNTVDILPPLVVDITIRDVYPIFPRSAPLRAVSLAENRRDFSKKYVRFLDEELLI
jgi:hypothetical protein